MRKLYVLFILLLSISLVYGQRPPKAISDNVTFARLDSVTITPLTNDSSFIALDTVCLTRVYGGRGWATVTDCKKVTYQQQDRGFYGRDTFYYVSCSRLFSSLCDTGRVFVTIRPRANNDTLVMLQPDSIVLRPLANDSNKVAGDSLCISSLFRPTASRAGWSVLRGCDSVKYRALNTGYWGLDTFYYKACSRKIPTLCDTGRVFVNLYFPPKAFNDSAFLIQPDSVSVIPLANDSTYIATDSTCVTSLFGPVAQWATLLGCDSLVYHTPDFHRTGTDTLYYVSCYTTLPTVCDTGAIAIKTTLPLPVPDFTYDAGFHCLTTAEDASMLSDSVHWEVTYIIGNGRDTSYGNTNLITIQADPDSSFQAEVCLTAYNPTGDTTVCYSFWIECIGSGIHDLDIANVHVYPNPATDMVHVDLTQINYALHEIASIEVADLTGRVLITEAMADTIQLSVRELSAGIYLLRCTDRNGASRGLAKIQVLR